MSLPRHWWVLLLAYIGLAVAASFAMNPVHRAIASALGRQSGLDFFAGMAIGVAPYVVVFVARSRHQAGRRAFTPGLAVALGVLGLVGLGSLPNPRMPEPHRQRVEAPYIRPGAGTGALLMVLVLLGTQPKP